ncbi:hypothetical protein PsorP6_006399 [Peronosclerospora sorghi]|uniref:Uncharacterized protein n=1 Tax=Peronosclerospora sorghi TaxID=230839 RepID=A0ACC0W1G1_9STRA|nr:hypothetical protein PsorP6_006399 [Peronosclerospora sorghi]
MELKTQIVTARLQREPAPQVPTNEQIFSCWEDAESQYCSYAATVGFEVRCHTTRNRANGECKRRDFVCNRHGFPDPKKTPEGSQPIQTPSTLTGCRAFIRVSRRDTAGAQSWVLTDLNLEHNHEMLTQRLRILLSREIPGEDQKSLLIYRKALVCVRVSMDVIAVSKKSTVFELWYTDKDVRNFLQRTSTACSHQDAVDMLSALKARKDEDGEFRYEFTQDGEGRLEHIFWREGASRRASLAHGDFIVLDTTYKLNRYNMPLAIFVGVNQHGLSIPLDAHCYEMRNDCHSCGYWRREKKKWIVSQIEFLPTGMNGCQRL